jgi:hypothetical protein
MGRLRCFRALFGCFASFCVRRLPPDNNKSTWPSNTNPILGTPHLGWVAKHPFCIRSVNCGKIGFFMPLLLFFFFFYLNLSHSRLIYITISLKFHIFSQLPLAESNPHLRTHTQKKKKKKKKTLHRQWLPFLRSSLYIHQILSPHTHTHIYTISPSSKVAKCGVTSAPD